MTKTNRQVRPGFFYIIGYDSDGVWIDTGYRVVIEQGESDYHGIRRFRELQAHIASGRKVMPLRRSKHIIEQADKSRLADDEDFFLTYGDGVADIDLKKLYDYHKKMGKIATVTSVSPAYWFGLVESEDGIVKKFDEKPDIRLDYDLIKDVNIESRGQIEEELGAGMTSTFGLAGFALPKKEKAMTYISIEYPLEDNTYTIVFGSTVGNELADLTKSYLRQENKVPE